MTRLCDTTGCSEPAEHVVKGVAHEVNETRRMHFCREHAPSSEVDDA